MVKDNGEDESVKKPADAFCNRKEVIEDDVSKEPDKKGQEDELRDNTDDVREEEGRRQENLDMHVKMRDEYVLGTTKWNEEDDQLGGDVNDEIGVVVNKMGG
ncbi:hypothetical protein M9H77_09032 [Catharanthus roseus]|uniref:Uncharacterized protein n=1 Tax=Catharanthus roseus TaxID=4058 RepID=A0ACC0BZE5_CATRO|nr:hypothetical protein M9H77_09032 [Catharanthus roseus]